MNLLQQYKDYIRANNLFNSKDKLLLAVSGGVDSVSLCELTKQAGYDFVIAHCNFKLRGEESERDMEFVKDLAKKYGVEYYVKEFETKQYATEHKLSIQEAARKLRYDWFAELVRTNESGVVSGGLTPDSELRPPDYLLTAHHADDNIETVLMNFFRGTGIKGLKGIEPKQGKIIRPLLFARRTQLEDFVTQNKLKYVTDSSNLKEDYSRNYFRNTVIPLLQKVFPEVNENILNNIERFRDVSSLYNQAIELHKKKLLEYKGEEIHIPVLKLKKAEPLKSVVYEIAKDWNFSSQQVNEIINLSDSETGKYICSATHRILKNRNWLIISPNEVADPQIILIEKGASNFRHSIFDIQFEVIPVSDFRHQSSNNVANLDAHEIQFPLILRKWKAGDYFYPLGMTNLPAGRQGKKKLSRFFIDQKLSKTEKEKVWVLEMNKKILWIVGHRIDDRFKITEKTKSVLKITYTNRQTE